MELFVRGRKVSLFGDEQIELTKNWNDQQVIAGYGSWSKTFSVPIDANNSDIFSYFNVIGAAVNSIIPKFNPNQFLESSIIINDYEIYGNIQVLSFSTKKMLPYQYNLVFYGNEKDLIKVLNSPPEGIDGPKLNDLSLLDVKFNFFTNNVIFSWVNTNSFHFVPLMATKRPLTWRDFKQEGNINSAFAASGITLKDLSVSYNFKQLLDKIFYTQGITINHSTNILKFLEELYVMINTKVEYGSSLTNVHTEVYADYLSLGLNKLKLTPTTDSANGALPGNIDFVSWNNITGYTLGNNYYQAADYSTYNFSFTFRQLKDTEFNINYGLLDIIDYDTNILLSWDNVFDPNGSLSINLKLRLNQKVYFAVNYVYLTEGTTEGQDGQQYTIQEENFTPFNTGELQANIKINKNSEADYDYDVNRINFPDMNISDFFLNFCKTFNIFFIYDDTTKVVTTYFKNDLPATLYDLTAYLLLDKDYTFNNQVKAKLVDYMFAEGKDINNISYKKATNINYGEYKKIEKYDVGNEKVEYKSMFTVFPRTILNQTDKDNNIKNSTNIPLHSELNESLSAINTDFLLMYRLPIVTGLTYSYNFQTGPLTGNTPPGYYGYAPMYAASDYGPEGRNGFSLDYNKLPDAIPDNKNQKYEVELDFLLPNNIMFNIKVYDKVIVHGIYYEISTITNNIKNNISSIKLISYIPTK